ncbi:MAG TPA: helix-turn-helix domain-containing protein [Ktedonosporobacter sp.]|nr:helix-turn-helix domain-containing protein [Ktedonosporobacter sp.]
MADADQIGMGKRLQREREHHHWTQEQLAEKIGASVPSLQRWEHGRAAPRQDMYHRLADVFGKPPEEWGRRPWNVPFLRNLYFTGREQILQRLHHDLAGEQVVALSQTRAISGLGGIGKTQTALEYAYRYADEYEAVLWIRADSYESLVSDYAALATTLNLPVQQERDQHRVASMVKGWLQKHSPWLLIFDNADDPALVTDFLPTRADGAILLTTRSQVTGSHIKKIEMEKMSREEGIDFLLRRINSHKEEGQSTEMSQQERDTAEQIWECMDGLPLALDQGAAYIEETGCALSDYLTLFKTRGRRLLELRGQQVTDHPEPVTTTWSLAFEKIERANSAAAELLRLCAFLHSDEIPESMIIEGASRLGPALQSIAAERLEWERAIGELRKYSLVKRDAKKRLLTMHRLVQAVIKDGMDKKTSGSGQNRLCSSSMQHFHTQSLGTGCCVNFSCRMPC